MPSPTVIRVFVLEDCVSVMAALARLLEHMCHQKHLCLELVTCTRICDAEQLTNNAFDLVICDHDLPDGFGTTVLRQLAGAHCVRVLMTGDSENYHRYPADEQPFDEFMLKPFERSQLVHLLDRVVATRHLGRVAA